MEEIWKDIPGYEGLYQVSSEGRVKGVDREIKHWKGGISIKKGKLLKPGINPKGYKQVVLCKLGKCKPFKISILVGISFLGHIQSGYKKVVDHIDGDRTNDRIENLRITTPRGNNSNKHKEYTSKFTGVHWLVKNKKWRSVIAINYKNRHLGVFKNEERAAEIYQLALQNVHLFDGDTEKFRDLINSL
jgi:hypothetical protein